MPGVVLGAMSPVEFDIGDLVVHVRRHDFGVIVAKYPHFVSIHHEVKLTVYAVLWNTGIVHRVPSIVAWQMTKVS